MSAIAFGEKLHQLRLVNGLTQEQFAEELKVSRQAVSKWESCRGYPEIEKILYICNRWGVTPNDLFADEVPLCKGGSTGAEGREEVPATLPRRTLHQSVSAFLANLTPAQRALAVGVLTGTLLLAGIIGVFLKGGNTDMTQVVWIIAMVLFGILEAVTVGLTAIWFVAGALAGLIVAMCGGPIWLQLTVFFIVSIAALVAARPLIVKYVNRKAMATNADRVVGSTARVTETVDNQEPTGAVYVDGKTWSARSEHGTVIEADTMVRVVRIEGVRLFVEELKEVQTQETAE